ncbi:hypothetical protein BJX99DRAFT_189221 [Aspergillus californicus]
MILTYVHMFDDGFGIILSSILLSLGLILGWCWRALFSFLVGCILSDLILMVPGGVYALPCQAGTELVYSSLK